MWNKEEKVEAMDMNMEEITEQELVEEITGGYSFDRYNGLVTGGILAYIFG